MKLNADSLPAQLAQRLLPAYLISGDEPLLAGEAADAVRARARAAGFSEREVHFIERAADWDDVRAAAGNLSLFATRRVIEVRLTSGKPGVAGGATLAALAAAGDPDTLLLVLAPRLDRDAQSAEWVRALESHGAWVQIWPVDASRLVGWLASRSRRGASISSSVSGSPASASAVRARRPRRRACRSPGAARAGGGSRKATCFQRRRARRPNRSRAREVHLALVKPAARARARIASAASPASSGSSPDTRYAGSWRSSASRGNPG